MKLEGKQLVDDTTDWISGFNPYCGTTIHFLDTPTPAQLTHAGRARHIDRIKAEVGQLSLRLDQAYFGTPHVASRVARSDRFEAFCVIEKLGIHPHVHMAWFDSVRSQRMRGWLEKRLRLACILETFNRGSQPLEPGDRALVDSIRKRGGGFEPTAVADWQAKGWSVFSHSIDGPRWVRYMLKELKTDRDFSDQMFFLSDLHSPQQRTKATRYFSIDPHTGARLLDLDAKLVPKR
jgi:hypothetical protein